IRDFHVTGVQTCALPILQNEGKLLRLAESYGVRREEFLKEYQGSELDPNWTSTISNLTSRGWKEFTSNEKDTIHELRTEIQNLRSEERRVGKGGRTWWYR